MRRDDLADLAAFAVVAEEGSFTRAAARLDVSQSALSHTMRKLEARLRLRLLTRTTRRVATTEAGERLLDTLRPAIDSIDRQLADLGDLRDRPSGTIRITASEHAAQTVLWPVIDTFLTKNPDVHVEINVEPGLSDIVAERYDAGVRLGEQLAKDMVAVPIGPALRMAAIAAPSYLAAHGTPQTPQDLTKHKCINLRLRSSGGLYVWEFEKGGRAVNVRVDGQVTLNSVTLILEAVRAGHGIAHVMEDRAKPLIKAGVAKRVLENWCPPFDGYHLVTLVTPRLEPAKLRPRWRRGARYHLGRASPFVSVGSPPPFHRTRTVAWAACEARLRKDGTGWTPSLPKPPPAWWSASTSPRTASTSRSGPRASASPCRATPPASMR
jgi:DNA-binding transcriptional LysR family regulator